MVVVQRVGLLGYAANPLASAQVSAPYGLLTARIAEYSDRSCRDAPATKHQAAMFMQMAGVHRFHFRGNGVWFN